DAARAGAESGSQTTGETRSAAATSALGADRVPVLAISALTGAGIDALISHLHVIAGHDADARGHFIPVYAAPAAGTFSARRRHLAALERAQARLVAARAELDRALELAAEELRAAPAAPSELTGRHTAHDPT